MVNPNPGLLWLAHLRNNVANNGQPKLLALARGQFTLSPKAPTFGAALRLPKSTYCWRDDEIWVMVS